MTTMVETPMMPPPGETREIQTREAINEALAQEMRRDETVIIMGEEIAGGAGREHLGIVDAWGGAFRTTRGLIQEFGNERVLDTPLSEAAFVGTAIGAASTGMRAVAELMFVDFVGVCMDQLLNNAAKMRYMFGGQVKVPFVMLTRIGAGFGSAAQHSESFYSLFSHIPGLKGVCPSDPYTAKGCFCRPSATTTPWCSSSTRDFTVMSAPSLRNSTPSRWARLAPSAPAPTSPWWASAR